jgi:4-carboxymuconolactone decarboxylase
MTMPFIHRGARVAGVIGLVVLFTGTATAQSPAEQLTPEAIEQAQRAVTGLRGGRIQRPASYDTLTPEQKSYVHSILSGPRRDIPPPLAVMLPSPVLGDLLQKAVAYSRFAGQDGFSSVPPKLNELAILMAARTWSGEYVWHAHHGYAVRVGLSPEVVEAVRTGRRPSRMQPDEEAVYTFLDEMISTRRVSDAAFQSAKAVLGGDRGVVDLIGTFALYSISSMMVMVDQMPLPDGVQPYLDAPVDTARRSPAGQSPGALEARLRRFEDTEEIERLLLDYGRHLDSRDLAAYSRLFATDGEWVGGFGSVTGPANIQAFMEKNLGTGPNRAGNYHLLSNFVITVDGDTATAWSRWAFVVPGERGATIAQAGRYDDTLVRENGHWRFKRRVASNDTPGPAAARQP